jgi:hydrogenase maturation factor
MCIARVGRVESVIEGHGRVAFFDGKSLDGVDVTVVGAGKGQYVEVFGNLAISLLSTAEARSRREAWKEVTKAAAADMREARRP